MTAVRVFFVGGILSYRALFGFLSPAVFIPTLILTPIFQILLFAYIGRAAGTSSDQFYVIGNAIQYTAVPCLVATSQMIAGERFSQTLGPLLISPASRVPIFLGRAFPVVLNGVVVAGIALASAAYVLGVPFEPQEWVELLPVLVAGAFSVTGLGLVSAAIGLRVRETAVLSNVLVGVLLILSGANIPLRELPHWLVPLSQSLPLTHAILAARQIAAGGSLTSVRSDLAVELAIGVTYALGGFLLIKFFERESRRTASLEKY